MHAEQHHKTWQRVLCSVNVNFVVVIVTLVIYYVPMIYTQVL